MPETYDIARAINDKEQAIIVSGGKTFMSQDGDPWRPCAPAWFAYFEYAIRVGNPEANGVAIKVIYPEPVHHKRGLARLLRALKGAA